MAQITMDHTNSAWQIVALLKRAGIDIKTFNEGKKDIHDLIKEIWERDVILIFDNETGRVTRFASSVKLLIVTTSPMGCLLETRREYEKSDEIAYTDECFSMSETRQRGESDLAAVLRGLQQEFGITIAAEELHQLSVGDDNPPAHRSTVYKMLWSQVVIRRYIWVTNMLFPNVLEPIKDNNVRVYVEWFFGLPKKVREWLGIIDLPEEVVQLLAQKQ